MAETEESRRPPQRLWAHEPSWPPRPAPPKRRRSNLFLTVVGLAIGAAVVVIVPAVLLALLILGRWLTAPPVPDGEPLRLAKTELVGTWQDEDGGRLVVAGDATFSAVDVCGDYSDGATGAQSGFDLASTMSGQ
ncbi:hypothetical protein ACFVXE_05755 [Streptomyces sp. NPDC058231]|uniref:hypothetical protein n=1 Tax=Streptomyces sp. NPDC058231 TaxID=3346392 RepID=UPI0036EDC121